MEENKNLNTNPEEAPVQENETVNLDAEAVQETEAVSLDAEAVQGGKVKPKIDWKKELREWVVSIAVALLVVFIIRNFLFEIIRVDGDSMYDTLHNNERLYVDVLNVRLHGVERGNIVICHYPNRGATNFVKRCVGVPGDVIYRENQVTHVVYEKDGQQVDEMLDERYGSYFPGGSSDDYEPYTLGENEYFVVGDNRYNSHDSRDWNDSQPNGDVGPITGDMIVGRVRNVIWPLSRFQSVEKIDSTLNQFYNAKGSAD